MDVLRRPRATWCKRPGSVVRGAIAVAAITTLLFLSAGIDVCSASGAGAQEPSRLRLPQRRPSDSTSSGLAGMPWTPPWPRPSRSRWSTRRQVTSAAAGSRSCESAAGSWLWIFARPRRQPQQRDVLGPDGKSDPERSLVGPLAAGVPGSPAGLFELHRRFGFLPWRNVVAPAVRLAAEGFAVTPRLSRSIAAAKPLLTRFSETAAVWLPSGQAPPPGTMLKLPALAATLRSYAARGPKALSAARPPMRSSVPLEPAAVSSPRLIWQRTSRLWRERCCSRHSGGTSPPCRCPSSGGISLAETDRHARGRLGWSPPPSGR